ncbi:MAG TPA: hypothetical protein VF114_08795 [Candidatus Limnocylindria bacterium]
MTKVENSAGRAELLGLRAGGRRAVVRDAHGRFVRRGLEVPIAAGVSSSALPFEDDEDGPPASQPTLAGWTATQDWQVLPVGYGGAIVTHRHGDIWATANQFDDGDQHRATCSV